MAAILIVENDPIVREPLVAWLSAAGHQAAGVPDGRSALRRIQEQRVDLIVMAIDTPLVDGVTLLSTLRNRHRLADLPGLFLLQSRHRGYQSALRKLEPVDYIVRDEFTSSAFLEQVAGLLEPGRRDEQPHMEIGASGDSPDDPSGDDVGSMPESETVLADAHGPADGRPAPPEAARAPRAQPVPPRDDQAASDRPRPQEAADLESLRPIRKRREIEELIDEFSDLSAMPPTVARVIKITNNPDCDIDTVVRAIRQDQALALKVLRLANSAAYARGDPIDSVQTAVMRIGLSQIRHAALSIAVIERFALTQPAASVHPAAFWQHSIACAVIAAELASACEASAEDAFMMGLLHDVGRMVLAEQLGEEYGEVVETARRLGAPLHVVERKMLIVDHAAATERLMRAWRFPKDLITCVGAHHGTVSEIRSASKEHRTVGLILALADRLSHAMLLGASGDETLTPAREFCEALSLTPETVAAILDRADEETDDIKFSLLADTHGEGAWPDERQRWSPRLPENFRPLHIGGPNAFDTLAVFSGRAKPQEPGPRTLAIAHVEKPADARTLLARLRDAEAFSGGENLPLIVVAPASAPALDPAIERERQAIRLPSPAPIEQLVDAINQCLPAREAAA